MKRHAAHVGIVVAWLIAVVVLTNWSASTPATVGLIAVTAGPGYVIGRWWVLLIPGVPVVLLIAYTWLFTSEADYYDDSKASVTILLLVAGVLAMLVLSGGVVLRQLHRG